MTSLRQRRREVHFDPVFDPCKLQTPQIHQPMPVSRCRQKWTDIRQLAEYRLEGFDKD